MSPSSRPPRGRRVPRPAALALRPAALAAALLLAAAAAGAQQAVLLQGPLPVKDLLMYPPNPLIAQQGVYRLPEPAEARVTVLFTSEPLVLPRAWQPRPCGTVRLLEVTGHDPYSLCYSDPQGGYTLFFSFPEPVEEALRCRFVQSFVVRFQVLRDLIRDESQVPFPGVLEISRP